jgi:hypothetical protein
VRDFKQIQSNGGTLRNSITRLAIKENHTNECEKWLDNFMVGVGRACNVWMHKGRKEGKWEERGKQQPPFIRQ